LILTGKEIHRQVSNGSIVIDPFDLSCLNPNSYNYHLGDTLKIAPDRVRDSFERTGAWETLTMTDDGCLLQPGHFYLGHTVERIGSYDFVTSLIGRSSLGRLGLFLNLSADLGHQGSILHWTLELFVAQPLVVYPGMKIGQVSFWRSVGATRTYSGVYADASEPIEWQCESFV
jgi:dCTP deaminase